jgi:hypothetical protein
MLLVIFRDINNNDYQYENNIRKKLNLLLIMIMIIKIVFFENIGTFVLQSQYR